MDEYLAREIASRLLPELGMWKSYVRTRLPKSFEGLDEEADAVGLAEWERLGRRYGSEDNADELAELAQERGLEHYESLLGIQSAAYGSMAATLYHWHEQWLLQLYREKFAPLGCDERAWMKDATAKKALDRFADDGTSLKDAAAWGKVHELSLLANTVKHGTGRSSEQLFALRPELFEPPSLGVSFVSDAPPSLLQPLGGFGGMYVTDSDLLLYCDALDDFWRETQARLAASRS